MSTSKGGRFDAIGVGIDNQIPALVGAESSAVRAADENSADELAAAARCPQRLANGDQGAAVTGLRACGLAPSERTNHLWQPLPREGR